MIFGDNISWEEHINVLPLNDKERLFYKYENNSEIIDRIKNHIGSLKGKKLLDVGSHICRWIEFFEGAGFDYTAVEQSSEVVKKAREYHPDAKIINSFAWDMNFGDKEEDKFDVAVSIAVLQHNTLEEKERIITKIYNSLKNNRSSLFFMTESTVLEETKTQLTYAGWINLVKRHGFELLEDWHKNENQLSDHYIFRKVLL